MKELTTQEKAKAYDEALERAREWSETKNGYYMPKELCEEIFPELTESEDEKIREALLEMVHDTTGDELWVDYNVHKEEALAWLEKQAEHANFRNKIQIGDKVTRNKDGVLVNLSKLDRVSKQGKNMGISEETKQKLEDNLNKAIEKETPESWNEFLDEQCEQKPTDKVEPKFNFKVGQWIVATGKCVYLIAKIDGFNVTLVDTNGNEYVFDTSSLEDAHLWTTIQDAKDGDVLAFDDKTIVIFKDLYNATTFHSYCHIEDAIFGVSQNGMPDWWDGKGFKPATKEQYDILMKAMTDAGYTFDFDKKELKEIIDKNQIKKNLQDNSFRRMFEQKPVWSEEDEQYLLICKNALAKYQTTDKWGANIIYHWLEDKLKSLRPQSRWKPSDEQMDVLLSEVSAWTKGCYKQIVLESLYNDLKKLKEE